MKLSVVIPCFNERAVILHQLHSLARQEWEQPWEVVVADNGSTDGTAETAESARRDLPQLKVIRATERRGASHARNAGVKAARGEFLAFVDADDEVGEGWLPAIAEAIERHRFVACRLDASKLNHSRAARGRGCSQTEHLQSGFVHPSLPYAGGGTLGIERGLHEAIGGFDETLRTHEDTDYCLRVQEQTGVRLTFAPAAMIHIRWPESLREGFQQLRGWAKQKISVRRRHWPEAPEDGLERYAFALAKQCARLIKVRDDLSFQRWVMGLGKELGTLEGAVADHLQRPEKTT